MDRLFPGFLRQLGLFDALFEFTRLVAAVFGLAEFLLNRLKLLVQIVLALGLLHLALDAVTDALFDLQDADFGFHERIRALQPFAGRHEFQQFLLLRNLQRQVRCDRVRQLRKLLYLVQRHQHFRRNLLVQLDVLLELADHRPAQRLDVLVLVRRFLDQFRFGLKEFLFVGIAHDFRALASFDQDLDRAIGQFEQLQHRTDRADIVDIVDGRIVLTRIFLRHKQNLLVVLHHVFQRLHRFVPPDEERHDHVREDNDIPQREYRKCGCFCGVRHIRFLFTLGNAEEVQPLPV